MAGYNYAHKDVALVQSKLDTANDAIAQRDKTIKDFEAATKQAQADEAAAKLREAKAKEDLATFKADNKKKDTAFTKSTISIVKKPECAVLKERLCPAAMGY
jgi:predicted  nucleic acid-binding Zn-ribbon protein